MSDTDGRFGDFTLTQLFSFHADDFADDLEKLDAVTDAVQSGAAELEQFDLTAENAAWVCGEAPPEDGSLGPPLTRQEVERICRDHTQRDPVGGLIGAEILAARPPQKQEDAEATEQEAERERSPVVQMVREVAAAHIPVARAAVRRYEYRERRVVQAQAVDRMHRRKAPRCSRPAARKPRASRANPIRGPDTDDDPGEPPGDLPRWAPDDPRGLRRIAGSIEDLLSEIAPSPKARGDALAAIARATGSGCGVAV